MPGPPPIYRSGTLQANQWTQIEWYVGTIWLVKQYFAEGGARVRWRWFSGGVVPYWEGQFQNVACISIPPGVYTSLEFNPDRPVQFIISATC